MLYAHLANISYAASKHAIESCIRSAAAEIEAEIAKETPLGRVGEPEDVADVIAFLASEQARWMTGQFCMLVADGACISTPIEFRYAMILDNNKSPDK